MNPIEEENVIPEKPKKKRGRPSKADKEAALLAQQQLLEAQQQQEKVEEDSENAAEGQGASSADALSMDDVAAAEAESDKAVDAPKKKRARKTMEEIIAAAEAKAEALAQANQLRAGQQTTTSFEQPTAMATDVDDVPEAAFAAGAATGDEMTDEQLAKLQQHVSRQSDEPAEDSVWEDDPGDGTDFIIMEDIPVEDNAVIPYYDMFDNPQNVAPTADDADMQDVTQSNEQFDFSDIVSVVGVLEIMPDGYGFLRSSDHNYLSSPDDVHLTLQQIRQYSLKTGDVVACKVRPPRSGERYFTMSSVEKVNGRHPEEIRDRISFENLTPLFPDEKFNLCGTPSTTNVSTRIVDLFSPIGKGQRSLIVAQPKTGKTILMKDIANAIASNHPEAYIMMLLIDERPEEVTDMARTVNAEVIASTFDEPADRHVKIAGLVLEKAKRLVECGHDVVIFLDSITRLARAYNTVAPASGKVLTGGVDANALQKPKRFFGAARNIEDGGSLTIVATALTDTGSKMDEVIFEEFKGTGNSELQLDRQLANKRIFPAVNLIASSTRRDDLLHDETTLNRMWILRKYISDMNSVEAMTDIQNRLVHTRNNQEFLMEMNK